MTGQAKFWRFIDNLLLFLQEARNRWKAHTPKFHRVLGDAALIAGIPAAFTKYLAMADIILPPTWAENLATVVTFCGIITKIITMFTFSNGQSVRLPYTEKMQKAKNDTPES